jgi:MFS family permease
MAGRPDGMMLGRRAGFVATAIAFAVAMLGTTLPTPLYAIYRERFGFSELTITVIFATYAAGVIASLLLFGSLSDQIGRRPLLLVGLALSALSAAVFLAADGLPLLLAGRVLSGLSAGILPARRPRRWWIWPAQISAHEPPWWRRSRTWAAWVVVRRWRGCSRNGSVPRCG